MYRIIIEQTKDYPKRMQYDPKSNIFQATEYDSLLYVRGVTFPYGWLKESGTPPGEHFDAILISGERYDLGEELPIRIIGVFKRSDNDHKLVAVDEKRQETDLAELSSDELSELYKLYPRIDKNAGEGWFGAKTADEVIKYFMQRNINEL